MKLNETDMAHTYERADIGPAQVLKRRSDDRKGLFVPIDHDDVLRPRSGGHKYSFIEKIILSNIEDIKNTARAVEQINDHQAVKAVRQNQENNSLPFWKNPFFTDLDAKVALTFLKDRDFRRIIEIGSGNSTKFFRYGIQQFHLDTQIISIDPFPRAEIDALADRCIRKSLLDFNVDDVGPLTARDLLFLDGSHLAFNGTDTVHFFLEILPQIPVGGYVHIHDIHLPFEYGKVFSRRGYNEQYLLACLLQGGNWKTVCPVYYLAQTGLLEGAGQSFWIQKVA